MIWGWWGHIKTTHPPYQIEEKTGHHHHHPVKEYSVVTLLLLRGRPPNLYQVTGVVYRLRGIALLAR